MCREAANQEQLAARISAATRVALKTATSAAQQQQQQQLILEDVLLTPEGAKATMRLAQALLAGYCAKLPGSDRCAAVYNHLGKYARVEEAGPKFQVLWEGCIGSTAVVDRNETHGPASIFTCREDVILTRSRRTGLISVGDSKPYFVQYSGQPG
jgi:hypothetical protein